MKEPRSMAICLEHVEATSPHEQFLQCVALPGNRPGLTLDASGRAHWCDDVPAACELWISADETLIALRPIGAPAVRLERAGRGLELPEGKPVEVIDEDELMIGDVQLCVHVHGFTEAKAAPCWLTPAPQQLAGSRGRAGATAAALAFGAAVTLGGMNADAGKSKPKPPVVVRPMPPAPPPPPPPPKKKPTKPKKKPTKKPSDKK